MAKGSIVRLFDSPEDAYQAVRELEAAGFPPSSISYMGGDSPVSSHSADPVAPREGSAATGATLGSVLGGGAGLLAGLGALVVPGVGPVVAVGWLVTALAGAGVGAAAGGVIGALVGAGLGEEDARTYTEAVRRGGHMVVLRADEMRTLEAEGILDRHHPVDMRSRMNEWRDSSWTGGHAAEAWDDSPAGGNDATRRHTGDAA